VIESGIEAIALETPPYFLPEHAAAAVAAGLHVYMAKPVAVDVPGCLAIEGAGQRATQQQSVFFVDYQMPTDPVNIEVATRIREGALGPLLIGDWIFRVIGSGRGLRGGWLIETESDPWCHRGLDFQGDRVREGFIVSPFGLTP